MDRSAALASAPPSSARAWILALRLPTLVAAVVPVLVGSAVAWREGFFRAGPAFGALGGALFIQIGTNLANDLYDFRKGADASGRLGPPRILALGWLAPEDVRRGMMLSFACAVLAGIYLAAVGGWPVILIGLASIAADIGYTAGRWALGYHGLGDLAVFVFFGLVAVGGTYFVQARTVSPLALEAAIPVGLLCTAILVVNNLRDIEGDRAAGKRTLAVLLGRAGARIEYASLLAASFAAPIALWAGGAIQIWALLPLAAAPHGVAALRLVLKRTDGPSLNRALIKTAQLHAWFGILFALGILAQ